VVARRRTAASDRAHDARVQRVYGLRQGEYAEMFEAQDGRCAICMNKSVSLRLAVDHNHATGNVRALLCRRCNRALGLVEYEPIKVYNLILYLQNILADFDR
jgi:type VI protein secretion system component VasA